MRDQVISDNDIVSYLQNAGFNPVKTVAPSKGDDARTSKGPAKTKRPEGLRQKDILQFERVGHVLARNLLLEDEVLKLREAVLDIFDRRKLDSYQQKCSVLGLGEPGSIAEAEELLATVDPEMVPFLQLFNLRKGERRLAIPPAVCKAAADLLGTTKLRIYQDSVRMRTVHSSNRLPKFLGMVVVCVFLLPLRLSRLNVLATGVLTISFNDSFSSSARGTDRPYGTRTLTWPRLTPTTSSLRGFHFNTYQRSPLPFTLRLNRTATSLPAIGVVENSLEVMQQPFSLLTSMAY